MGTCEVCGDEYDMAFEVVAAGARHVFDSFECATRKAMRGRDVGELQGSEGRSLMNAGMFPIIVFGGVLAGWLAGFVMERGGYGLKRDIVLGLTGSAVMSWIFWALGASPGAGLAVLAVVAFVGAVLPIVAQRQFGPRPAKGVTLTPRAALVPERLSPEQLGEQHG
jgi:uncharacterized membrane protein YeaQ/YmgE (transglycosylase-associated protein family)